MWEHSLYVRETTFSVPKRPGPAFKARPLGAILRPEMNIVYRKTPKGVAEIETRAHRLLPRLRSALILVDGKRSDDELALLVAADPGATLASLLDDGFIEVLATLADRPAVPRQPSTAAAAPAAASAASGRSIDALRREAVRYLTDQLGPGAESVAIKIERAKTMPELQPVLAHGAQVLRDMRGAAAAEAFTAKFIAAPET